MTRAAVFAAALVMVSALPARADHCPEFEARRAAIDLLEKRSAPAMEANDKPEACRLMAEAVRLRREVLATSDEACFHAMSSEISFKMAIAATQAAQKAYCP